MAEGKPSFGMEVAAGAANTLLGQIGSSIFGAAQDRRQLKQQKKLNALQIEGNKEMSEFQRQQAMKMWKDTNYSAQVEEAKKAGMSISALYGGTGASGATTGGASAGSVSGASAGDPNQGVNMGLQMASQLALQKAQKENIEADTENKKAASVLAGEDLEKRKYDTLTQGEEFTKKAAESQEAVRGLEDRLTRIKAEAAGAEIENEAKKVGITVDKEKIKQMAATVAQGWESLEQGQQKIRIDQFRAEMEKAYPGLMNVAGRTIDDTIEALFKHFNSNRNKQLKRVGKQ